MSKILVVDDDAAMREVLKIRLQNWGFEARTAEHAQAAQAVVGDWDPDIVLSDVIMPGLSGLDLLKLLKGENRDRPVILITAHGEVESAVEAMKIGAADFITKPIDYDYLRSVLDDCLSRLLRTEKSRQLSSRLEKGNDFGPFVGRSRAMQQVYRMIGEIAGTVAAVLITGPSGTGKELAAQTIHDLSDRHNGPFIPVNAAAVPADLIESELFGHEKGAFTGAVEARPGCFESADRGTLFLDEIAEMPVNLQAKLLRVLEDGRVRRVGGREERQFDVRIIAATNQDPHEAVEKGKLREDLFYRINIFTLEMPALRDRRSDIPALVHRFISNFNRLHNTRVKGFSEEVESIFDSYLWPGNVRELRNTIERATVLAKNGWIEPCHLPVYIRHGSRREEALVVLRAGTSMAEAEKQMILRTLELTGYNKADAARRLGMDVKTLRNKLKEYGSS